MTEPTSDNTPLGRLTETVQRLTESDSPTALYDRLVAGGERLAGCEQLIVYEFSEEQGVLIPVAGAKGETTAPVEHGDGIVWEAFMEGHVVRSDLANETVIAVPISTHGVVVATLDQNVPAETNEALTVLAHTVAAFRDRQKSDERAQAHEHRVDEQARDLERAATLNAIFGAVGEAIVTASTLSELSEAVCESFEAAKPYVFAWLCRYDDATSTLDVVSQAGIASDYGEQFTSADRTPNLMETLAATVTAENEATVENVLDSAEWRTERKDALTHGFNSVVAIPIGTGEQTTHVLFVHVATAHSVTDTELTAFSNLGQLIGHGFQTVVRAGRQLTDERVEIEVHTADERLLCNRLSAKLNCRMNIEGILSQAEGQTVAFVSFVDIDPDSILETATEMENVVELGLISASDSVCLFEMRFSEPALIEILDAHGAVLKEMGTQHGQSHILIDVHPDVSVREIVDAIKRAYPDTTLAARRDHTTPRQTRHTFYALLEAELTEKQLTALKTAYLGGFYEWPRVTNGEELAATLDISAPTLQYHLRAAERKLVTLALDGKL
ncbi:bacterio-opsin activator domain-containing protein [Haladaptatus sp. DJG-WS-42]|uniref:bacterio-opsin activator domain-containing protein n=1 Tax=Haladaptatus sp. DJG-WS-42 TaxID=3120516 RepID=UPI0030D224E0